MEKPRCFLSGAGPWVNRASFRHKQRRSRRSSNFSYIPKPPQRQHVRAYCKNCKTANLQNAGMQMPRRRLAPINQKPNWGHLASWRCRVKIRVGGFVQFCSFYSLFLNRALGGIGELKELFLSLFLNCALTVDWLVGLLYVSAGQDLPDGSIFQDLHGSIFAFQAQSPWCNHGTLLQKAAFMMSENLPFFSLH